MPQKTYVKEAYSRSYYVRRVRVRLRLRLCRRLPLRVHLRLRVRACVRDLHFNL